MNLESIKTEKDVIEALKDKTLFERDVHISPELMEYLTTGNLFIRGSSGAVWDKAFEAVSQGTVNTKDLITHEFRLDEIKQAFEMQLNAEEAVKVIVKP